MLSVTLQWTSIPCNKGGGEEGEPVKVLDICALEGFISFVFPFISHKLLSRGALPCAFKEEFLKRISRVMRSLVNSYSPFFLVEARI